MAGVIGYHKPQFSLIGDTVNTTSRVCSNGANGKIILSENAFFQIKKEFYEKTFFVPKIIEAKGKGKMTTYVLENGVNSSFERTSTNQMRIKNSKGSISINRSPSHKMIQRNSETKDTLKIRARGKSVFILHFLYITHILVKAQLKDTEISIKFKGAERQSQSIEGSEVIIFYF